MPLYGHLQKEKNFLEMREVYLGKEFMTVFLINWIYLAYIVS